MRREVPLVIGWCIVMAVSASCRGEAQGTENSRSSKPDAGLTVWEDCQSQDFSVSPLPLRNLGSGIVTIDDNAFRSVRDRLDAGIHSKRVLCEIDRALVELQHQASFFQDSGNAGILAGLMRLLAFNWMQQGALARADELFQHGYDIEENKVPSDFVLGRIAILQGWAYLKLKLGEPQRAKDLAGAQTALSRKHYQALGASYHDGLVSSLEFEASVLEKIGEIEGAQAARQEAEKLAALPNQCHPVCAQLPRKLEKRKQ